MLIAGCAEELAAIDWIPPVLLCDNASPFARRRSANA